MPDYIRRVVEQLAFLAREDKRIDQRSGVSQRLPISVLENVVSNAERRALRCKDDAAVPRVTDIYSALPPSPASSNWNTRASSKAAIPWPAN